MSASADFSAWLDQYVADRETAAALEASTALQQDLDQANATIADLQAQLAACQEAQKPAPTPTPDVRSTMFGTSTPNPDSLARARGYGFGTFRRFFAAGLPSSWGADSVLSKTVPGDTWIISHKTATNAEVTAFLKTAPPDIDVWMCRHHEPENDNVDKAAYRAAQASHAQAVHAAGFKACLILMGYTSEPGSGRDYRDWYSPEVDAIFWDAYNSGNKKSPPVFETPAHIIEGILTVAAETGKPWGVTETGAKVGCVASNGFASRPEWAAAYAQELKANGALFAIWWDQVNASGTFDVRLDPETAAAWQ